MFLPARWPVINVLNAQGCRTQRLPPEWQLIPIEQTAIVGGFNEDPALSYDPGAAGSDSYRIEIAPGYLSWVGGRNNARIQVTYVAGWPHTTLTTAAAAGDTTVTVDDVTGFAGLAPMLLDEPDDEVLNITSTTADTPMILPAPSHLSIPTGPGTLTLLAPLTFAHEVGATVSTLPYTIQQAMILYATATALVRGASSISAQRMPSKGETGAQGGNAKTLVQDAKDLLAPYKRIL